MSGPTATLTKREKIVHRNEGGIGRVEVLDQISMAFLVVLQRLTPAERAVLLLREVFDFDYKEIAALVGKSEPACRKLLERARQHVMEEKRLFSASPEAHRRLLAAFTEAASAGDIDALVGMLAEDAVMVTDGGAARQTRRRHSQSSGAAQGCREDRRVRRRDGAEHGPGNRDTRRCCSRSPTTASTASTSTLTSHACVTWDREAVSEVELEGSPTFDGSWPLHPLEAFRVDLMFLRQRNPPLAPRTVGQPSRRRFMPCWS